MVQPQYREANPRDVEFGGARDIVEEEARHLKGWRGRPPEAGLALSGGGIRSASYCLGVLQALANANLLEEFDYLSTVSGGGYTGASLSYLLYQSSRKRSDQEGGKPWPKFDATRDNFPYLSNPMVSSPLSDHPEATAAKGDLLRSLRENANYLEPGRGVTLLSMIGVGARNMFVSLVVHLSLLVAAMQVVFWMYTHDSKPLDFPSNWILWGAGLPFGVFGLMSLGYVLFSATFEHHTDATSYWIRRHFDVLTRWLLTFGIGMLILGVLPYADAGLIYAADSKNLPTILAGLGVESPKAAPTAVGLLAAVVGVLGNVWGYLQTGSKAKPLIPTSALVKAASCLMLFGLLLVSFHFVVWGNSTAWAALGLPSAKWVILPVALALFLVFGLVPDVNYVSMHRYYRDRLMETFLPDVGQSLADGTKPSGVSNPGNETLLGKICGANGGNRSANESPSAGARTARGPYHIVNATIVLVASKNSRYRGRGGDNFILSPLFTGSGATGWERTDDDQATGVSLATAMAISGAAISPNAGAGGEGITRQPILSVLMGMFNIRMGYWLANPNPMAWSVPLVPARSWFHPNLIYPGLAESFGRGILHEDAPYVLLSDGGHFENLGLYELIRRRLKVIVVCDGTADPDYTFSDLANAIEKVRADFGALINITTADLRALVPTDDKPGVQGRASMATSERGYLIAKIRYAKRPSAVATGRSSSPADDEEETGTLIYLNTTFFKGLRADLQGYRSQYPQFPDQPTTDQFFDEKEFEAYRELGFQTAWQLASGPATASDGAEEDLFAWLRDWPGWQGGEV